MRLTGLEKRLSALEPEPEPEPNEAEALLFQAFKPHYLIRLAELGCDVQGVEAATTFDQIDAIHPHGSGYLVRSAHISALADAAVALGEDPSSDYTTKCRKAAAQDLEWEKKDRQTHCDRCGHDLDGWSCYSGNNLEKLCKKCAGY